MSATTSIAAIVFYLGVAALGGGAILGARAALERGRRDPRAFVLAGCGALAVGTAIVIFATGPKETLPF